MKDVTITVICVAILGAAGFFGTYKFIEKQQTAALADKVATLNSMKTSTAADKVQKAGEMSDVSNQQSEDTAARYKYSAIVGAVGILIGIGTGVLICDMLEKKQPKPPVPA